MRNGFAWRQNTLSKAKKRATVTGRAQWEEGQDLRSSLPAIAMNRSLYPSAVALAADAFADITAIFAAPIPNAFALLEATGFILLADILLLVAFVAASLVSLRLVMIAAVMVLIVVTASVVSRRSKEVRCLDGGKIVASMCV
jgi:hypothetical protein